jgi:L-seryl-tRNA(Ser) seleniumtransferase
MAENPFRALPSVSELSEALSTQQTALRGAALIAFCQHAIDDARRSIEQGARPSRDEVIESALEGARSLERSRFDPAINATGVVLHTNLGRSPVSVATAQAMQEAASHYVSLELDPETNLRGGRMTEISELLRLLSGAESTLVVNNNAAAVLLVLSALAAGREVIVSRGEAIEIGGGFRIPDVLLQSGARLVEVGTTNKTYARDYEWAVTAETSLFLKAHASNFTIQGFTSSPGIGELAALSRRTGIPIVEDLGSGALLDTTRFGLAAEPLVGDRIVSGVDVVTASGDKLLGGPQAGIIAGRADLIERVAAHPLARAVRADKATLAGVAATLRHYLRDEAIAQIPIWRMIAASEADLDGRARDIAARFSDPGVEVVETRSTIGGGSLPGETQPSRALAIVATAVSVDELARSLRTGAPRVFGRIENDRLLLDLRAVLPEQDDALTAALQSLATSS